MIVINNHFFHSHPRTKPYNRFRRFHYKQPCYWHLQSITQQIRHEHRSSRFYKKGELTLSQLWVSHFLHKGPQALLNEKIAQNMRLRNIWVFALKVYNSIIWESSQIFTNPIILELRIYHGADKSLVFYRTKLPTIGDNLPNWMWSKV